MCGIRGCGRGAETHDPKDLFSAAPIHIPECKGAADVTRVSTDLRVTARAPTSAVGITSSRLRGQLTVKPAQSRLNSRRNSGILRAYTKGFIKEFKNCKNTKVKKE